MTIDQVYRNAWLCRWLELHWGTFFGGSIMVLYYQQHGLTQHEVFTLQATIAIVTVLYDIPGGYFADRFGIRQNILIGTFIIASCAVAFCFCQTFWQFEITLAISSVGWCSISNTTPALMQLSIGALEDDSIQPKERKKLYKKYVVDAALMRNIGLFLGILGGWGWYRVADRYGWMHGDQGIVLFAVQPIVYVIAMIAGWRLVSPLLVKSPMAVLRPSYWSIVWTPLLSMGRTARMMLWERPDIRWFVAAMAVIQTAALASFWLLQPAMQGVHIHAEDFGLFYAGKSIVTIALGKCMPALRYFGDMVATSVVLGVVILGTLSVSVLPGIVGVAVLFVSHAFATAFMSPLQTLGLKALLPGSDGYLATELSVCTAVSGLLFGITTPFLGSVTDTLSVGAALLIIGSTALCLGTGVLYLLGRTGRGR